MPPRSSSVSPSAFRSRRSGTRTPHWLRIPEIRFLAEVRKRTRCIRHSSSSSNARSANGATQTAGTRSRRRQLGQRASIQPSSANRFICTATPSLGRVPALWDVVLSVKRDASVPRGGRRDEVGWLGAPPSPLGRGSGLRPSTSARLPAALAAELLALLVGHVEHERALARIGEPDPHLCALALHDLLTREIGDEKPSCVPSIDLLA